jgi:hypothetical protein
MAGPYETWMGGLGFGPNWMHDPVGNAYWGAVGAMIDQQVARMKLALRCRYPADALTAGMSDALDEAGKDRLLPRGGTTPGGSNESDASYAPRLQDPWSAWAQAGKPLGLLTALKVAGFPVLDYQTVIINHIGHMFALDAGGALHLSTRNAPTQVNRTNLHGVVPPVTPLSGFTLDTRDQFFSHFVILFLAAVTGLDNTAGNVVKACLNQTVERWQTGGAIYGGAAVVPPGALVWEYPITTHWDDGYAWGDNGASFIDPQ